MHTTPRTAKTAARKPSQITKQARYDWHHHVGIVRRGKETLANVAESLMQIRDRELWLAQYPTWDAFVGGELDFSKRHANRIVAAGKLVAALPNPDATPKTEVRPDEVGPRGPTWPANERQARELSRLGNDDPDAQSEAFGEAVVAADGEQPSVAQIKQVIDARIGDTLLDGLGQPVPKRLREAFENREKLLKAINCLTQAGKFVRAVIGRPGGENLTPTLTLSKITTMRGTLARDLTPFSICTDCRGIRADCCERCLGLGWLTRADLDKEKAGVFKSVPPEEKRKRAESRDLEKEIAERTAQQDREKEATAREIAARVGAAALAASESTEGGGA